MKFVQAAIWISIFIITLNVFPTDSRMMISQDSSFAGFEDFLETYYGAIASEKTSIIESYINWQQTEGGGFPVHQNDTHVVFIYYNTTRDISSCKLGGEPFEEYVSMDQLDEIHEFYYKQMQFDPETAFQYYYVINGLIEKDYRNPLSFPFYDFGYERSILQMPQFKETIDYSYRENIPHGTLEALGSEFENPYAEIYLPPEYDGSKEYPSVYFADGYSYHWMDAMNIIDNLIADGKIIPILAVFDDPVDLVRAEIESYDWKKRSIFYGGCSSDFVDYMITLQEFVDREYPTVADRMARLAVGLSSSADGVLNLGSKKSDIFGMIGSQSSAVDLSVWNSCNLTKIYQGIDEEMKIWFSIGKYELSGLNRTKAHEQLVEVMEAHNWEYEGHFLHEYHSYQSWRHTLDDLLIFFFAPDKFTKSDQSDEAFILYPAFPWASVLLMMMIFPKKLCRIKK